MSYPRGEMSRGGNALGSTRGGIVRGGKCPGGEMSYNPLVLLDLSSAFDTVDHETLIHVLQQRFGVEGPALTWFGSYLCCRTQAFYHNIQQSGPYRVDCSVPQGSVIGPKEFIAYTEELAVLINSYQLGQHLYADDAQLMKRTCINNVAATIQTLQQCIKAIHQCIKTTSAESIED